MAARRGPDTVALILTVTVAVVVIGTAAVVLILEVLRPQQGHAAATEAIGRIVSVLVAARERSAFAGARDCSSDADGDRHTAPQSEDAAELVDHERRRRGHGLG